jgi:DNA polymerase-3 subunit gamma/tau
VVGALAREDAAAAFDAVERVLQTGQDPRRFVEDLLERLRDLIVLAAAGEGAASVLTGVAEDERARMTRQAAAVGADRLSRTADVVLAALDEMTGATSPRLQLELMVARVLVRAASTPETEAVVATPAAVQPGAPAAAESPPEPTTPAPEPAASDPVGEAPSLRPSAEPLTLERVRSAWPAILGRLEQSRRSTWLLVGAAEAVGVDGDVLTLAFASRNDVEGFKRRSAGHAPSEDLRAAIEAVLGVRVKFIARHEAHDDDSSAPGTDREARAATMATTPSPAGSAGPRDSAPTGPVTDWPVAAIAPDPDSDGDPADSVSEPSDIARPLPVDDEPEDARATAPARTAVLAPDRYGEVLSEPVDDADEDAPDPSPTVGVGGLPHPPAAVPAAPAERYGEAVVRQILGARFVGEEPYAPPAAR